MKITFPYWGNYTVAFELLAKKLNLEVVTPEKTSPKTIEKGVKIAPEMYCFPLKVNLGNFLEAIEKGADTIVMPTALGGSCRLRYYAFVEDKVLKENGKDVNFVVFDQSLDIFSKLKKLSGASFLKMVEAAIFTLKALSIIEKLEKKAQYLRPREIEKGDTDRVLISAFKRMREIEKFSELLKFEREVLKEFSQIKIERKKVPRVGIIGEIYTVSDHAINFEIEKKLGNLGIEVHRQMALLYHLKKKIFFTDFFIQRKIKPYLGSTVGGHGRDAIYEMLKYVKEGFDGVIQLLPAMCVPPETGITVENYLQKPIKDIKIGEKVLTHKGRFKKVTQKFCRDYRGPLIKIDCGGKLLTLSVTPEHPLLMAKTFVKNHKKEIERFDFIPASEAKKGDFLAIPIPKVIKNKKYLIWNKSYNRKPKWEDIKKFPYSPELLRMLGYWLAEGHIKYEKYKYNPNANKMYPRGIVFSFSPLEKEYIDDVITIAKKNFKVGIAQYSPKPTTLYLNINNRNLADIVYFLCGSHCDRKVLHSDLMNLKSELQKEILKGFFRGDGNLRDEYGETTYRGVTTSWNLANQLFWLLIRNRIKPSFLIQNIKDKKPSWMIKIADAEGIKRLGDELIKVTERKNNVRFKELEDYFLVPIRKIEVVNYKGKVYNLEVEDDHSYVANFLVVHNCMPETTVRPILEKIHQETGIPFLSLSLDEQVAEAGIDTRIEAFVDVVKNYHKNKHRTSNI
jgi:predicted nucleotide-binding protein (sugar kinase/HSP70/actin superfamily)